MLPISMYLEITPGKCRLCIYFRSQHECYPPNIRKYLVYTSYRHTDRCAEIEFSARQNAENEHQQT